MRNEPLFSASLPETLGVFFYFQREKPYHNSNKRTFPLSHRTRKLHLYYKVENISLETIPNAALSINSELTSKPKGTKREQKLKRDKIDQLTFFLVT